MVWMIPLAVAIFVAAVMNGELDEIASHSSPPSLPPPKKETEEELLEKIDADMIVKNPSMAKDILQVRQAREESKMIQQVINSLEANIKPV